MSDPDDHFHEPVVKQGYAVDIYPVRWKPYKPEGQRQMKRKGRWQRMSEYGGWENCDTPNHIFPEPPTVGTLSWCSPLITPKSQGNARRVLVWLERIHNPPELNAPGKMTFGHRIPHPENPPPDHWPKDGWFFDERADQYEVRAWAYADPPELPDGR
jgi:hypothetical protein